MPGLNRTENINNPNAQHISLPPSTQRIYFIHTFIQRKDLEKSVQQK